MNKNEIAKVRLCRHLLPPPGAEVVGELLDEIEHLQKELAEMEAFHPRAMKLIQKRKNFIVVADDEPYYFGVYGKIREHEKEIGRWNDEDERAYQNARKDYFNRPLPQLPKEITK